jgi:hypothetical protein
MIVSSKIKKTSFIAVAVFLTYCAPVHAAGPSSLALSCSGNSYKHDDPFPKPIDVALSMTGTTVKVAIGKPGDEQKESARVVSNNTIQLKFTAGKFTGEYFHLTGDLFLIHKDGRLIRLVCKPE